MPQQKIEWGYANIEEHLYLKHLPTKNYFLVGGLHKVKGCSLVRCNSCPTEYKPLDLEAAALFIGLGRFDFDYLDSEEYKRDGSFNVDRSLRAYLKALFENED